MKPRIPVNAAERRLRRVMAIARVETLRLLRDRVAYGTPDMVVERLSQLQDELGLSGLIMESNVGGLTSSPGSLFRGGSLVSGATTPSSICRWNLAARIASQPCS